MKVENREKEYREKARVDDPGSRIPLELDPETAGLTQHGINTAPEFDHPEQTESPGGRRREYRGNIEERHDNAAEHPDDLNYPLSFTDRSAFIERCESCLTASNPFCSAAARPALRK